MSVEFVLLGLGAAFVYGALRLLVARGVVATALGSPATQRVLRWGLIVNLLVLALVPAAAVLVDSRGAALVLLTFNVVGWALLAPMVRDPRAPVDAIGARSDD